MVVAMRTEIAVRHFGSHTAEQKLGGQRQRARCVPVATLCTFDTSTPLFRVGSPVTP